MKKVKLGDVLDVTRGASLSGNYYSTSGNKIRLTLGNFNYPGGGFKENTSKDNIYFAGPIRDEFIMHKGDIITPLTEQVAGLLGETARIPEDGRYIQSGDIGHVIPDTSKLDDSYAYYLLASPSIKKQLGAAAQQTKIRHTSPEKIKDCDAWLPDIKYQHKAGILLDSINAKICNNNAISSQLESMAKTIYDYWFLQFDFPDESGRPYRSSGGKMVWNEELKMEIPEGWKTIALSEMFQITMGSSPKGESLNEDGDGMEFYQGSTDFGDIYPVERVYTTSPVRKALSQDILLSVRAPVGDMNIAMNDCCIGRGLAAVHSDSALFAWNTLKTLQPYFDVYNNNGTTFGALTADSLKGLLIPEIPQELFQKYVELVHDFEQIILKNEQENRQLSSLRDFLLPMLMNGQVSFKNQAA